MAEAESEDEFVTRVGEGEASKSLKLSPASNGGRMLESLGREMTRGCGVEVTAGLEVEGGSSNDFLGDGMIEGESLISRDSFLSGLKSGAVGLSCTGAV